MITKGHNSVVNLQKWVRNNPNLDMHKINAFAKLVQALFVHKILSGNPNLTVERCDAVVKRRTRDREVPVSIPTNCKCCFLEQEYPHCLVLVSTHEKRGPHGRLVLDY